LLDANYDSSVNPDSGLLHLARDLAARVDVADPHAWFAGVRIHLNVQPNALSVSKKTIHGAWDPLLRRIDLFGCSDVRSDGEITRTLGHEIWHALCECPGLPRTESGATRFAELFLIELGPARVRECAAALRRSAASASTHHEITRDHLKRSSTLNINP
jgi:hypothetical protein